MSPSARPCSSHSNTNHIATIVCKNALSVISAGHAIGMTLEMAEALLIITKNHKHIVGLIVSACDYRLTEMLRARGLYANELTIKSSHYEFIM